MLCLWSRRVMPSIILSIFLCATASASIWAVVKAQVSLPYVITGSTYSLNTFFLICMLALRLLMMLSTLLKAAHPKVIHLLISGIPKIHDLYKKDTDMRKLERQLCVLPDLLNSCPDIASKVTRVRTLANMLAAAPLASSMFSEVDKLVRIYLTIPVTTATGERSLSAVRCIKTT